MRSSDHQGKSTDRERMSAEKRTHSTVGLSVEEEPKKANEKEQL
jgi:hypothetical protein